MDTAPSSGDFNNAGAVGIDVEPSTSAEEFAAKLQKVVVPAAEKAGRDAGEQFGKGFKDKAGKPVEDTVPDAASKSRPRTQREGEESGGAFARAFKTRVEAALRDLPKFKVDADLSGADEELAKLRAEMAALSTKKIGVDLSAADAMAHLDEIKARLRDLGEKSPKVDVKVDVTAALAKLALIDHEIKKVRRDAEAPAGGGAGGAAAASGGEESALAGLGSAIAEGVGGIGLMGAGIGALIVLAGPLAAALVGAFAAIGAAVMSVFGGIMVTVLALKDVIGAVQALGQQQASAAQDNAARAQSEQALANVRANNANQARLSAQQVSAAERGLATAQREALLAQQQLTVARKEAKQALEDLNNQVVDGQLAQRQASIDLIQAKQALEAANANPLASPLQREQAQLAYDQARQHVKELALQQGRLVDQQKAANKAGVEGSTQVTQAKQNITAANQRVADAEQALANARIAQAQQARQAMQSLEQAERAVGQAGASSMNAVNEAMGKLSPTGQAFARFLFGLKGQFDDLKKVAEDGLLPGLEAGLKAVLPLMPFITAIVRVLATTMGTLFEQAGKALNSPFWRQFFSYIAQTAGPVLLTVGQILGDFAKGFAGLFMALGPVVPVFLQGIKGIADTFAEFGAKASKDKGFQAFVAFIITNGPKVFRLLLDLAVVLIKLVIALAPLGMVVLDGLLKFFDWLSKQNPTTILGIVAAVAAIIAVIAGFAGGVGAAVIAAVIAIVAVAALLVTAYQKVKWFRDLVDGYFSFVKFMWERVWKPVLEAVGQIFLWLWRHVIVPVWDGIKTAIHIAWRIIEVIFAAIVVFVAYVLAPIFFWLWHNVIEPVWDGIKPIFKALGDFISTYVAPAFEAGVHAIATAWNKVMEVAKTPVEFIVDTVINKGIIKAYNDIVDKFDKSLHIAPIQLPWETPGGGHGIGHKAANMATGGPVYGPGTGTSDSVPRWLSNGEHVWTAAEVAAAGGHAGVMALRSAILGGSAVSAGGGLGLARGGIVDSIADTAAGLFGGIGDALKLLARFESTGWGRAVSAVPRRIVDVIGGALGGLFGGGGSSGGGGGAGTLGQVMGWIMQAVAATGVPASWAGGPGLLGLYTLVMRESGGNPRAINTWDENALRGDPSRGLAQTIGATFEHYRLASLPDDIYNPVSNLAAAIEYILHTYGSIGNVQQANPLLPPHGYDAGGWLMPGLTFNGTAKPEPVLTDGQWQAVSALAARGARGGDGASAPQVHVELHGSHMTTEQQVKAVGREVAWTIQTA